MLLPCTDNVQRNITLNRPSQRVSRFDSLPFDIERALLTIIEKEVDMQRRLDILKSSLSVRYDFSPMAAFRAVDKYNAGRIDTFSTGNFLRTQGHYATETELLAIVRRIDTDGDAKLDYSEFAEFLSSSYQPSRPSGLESTDRG